MKKTFKRNSKIFNIALVALAGGALASCSNELDAPVNGGSGNGNYDSNIISLMKDPEMMAWSGNASLGITAKTFGNEGSARAEEMGDYAFYKVQDYTRNENLQEQNPWLYNILAYAPEKTDRGESVSTAEYEFVIDYIKNHPDEGGNLPDISTYFIQNVGSSKDSYTLEFKNGDQIHHTQVVVGGNQMDYLEIGSTHRHINDYNASGGPRELIVNLPLEDPDYKDSYAGLIVKDAYKFYVIEFDGKMNGYLCFDYRTKKNDNGWADFKGDGVYNDWVIKIIPADGSSFTRPGDDDNQIPGDGDDDDKIPGDPDEDSVTILHNDEVEINLSINDPHQDMSLEATVEDLVSKLSIHVRKATDVEVFIPVSAIYYCDEDDVAVLEKHKDDLLSYGKKHTAQYIVDGNPVTLTVEYVATGIRIYTDGINDDVIQYLFEKNGDGINFEVYNYYCVRKYDEATGEWYREGNYTIHDLKDLLNLSTVKFLDDYPAYYINAFGFQYDETGNKIEDRIKENDCKVAIDKTQEGSYNAPGNTGCEHLNGTPFNFIYVRKDVTADDAHTKH